MGNHRAEVLTDSRPSEETPQPTPYVGKRRAALPETPIETPAAEIGSYVGKRRAAPVGQTDEPALGVPAPRRTIEETPAATPETDRGIATPPAATPAAATPAISADTDVAAGPEATVWTDLRIDTGSLPPIDETARYATDFSFETTSNLPVVPALATGKRRAETGTTRSAHPLAKRIPSAPVLLGVAALAIAVGGAVTAAHAPSSKTTSRFVAASALSGASDVGQVGTRSGTVSRSSDRNSITDQANQAAEQRAASLSAINNKAAAMDKWKAANQWGLPIPAGQYHLTGRFDDVSGLWATVHTGLDFACPTGTPIHAVASGTITQVGWAGAYGNRTVETLPDGTELWYAHQVRFGATVGEKVTEGEVMGYVGSTGNTTGPHVHIEVRPGGGDPVDPDTALKAHGIDPDANQS